MNKYEMGLELVNGKILHEIAWQVLDDFAASQNR
jgi:hypothetical protein